VISLPDLLTMIGNSFALLSSRTRARLSCLVQPGLMILGDLSIQGNIKSVKSLSEPLQVGMDNGARRALIPLENKRRVIVEAKFMRPTDAPKDMIEQIAEDASLYLVLGSKYDSLIPFIWDDSRRTEHHGEMVRGLRQISGVKDAVIVSRPGSMKMD